MKKAKTALRTKYLSLFCTISTAQYVQNIQNMQYFAADMQFIAEGLHFVAAGTLRVI